MRRLAELSRHARASNSNAPEAGITASTLPELFAVEEHPNRPLDSVPVSASVVAVGMALVGVAATRRVGGVTRVGVADGGAIGVGVRVGSGVNVGVGVSVGVGVGVGVTSGVGVGVSVGVGEGVIVGVGITVGVFVGVGVSVGVGDGVTVGASGGNTRFTLENSRPGTKIAGAEMAPNAADGFAWLPLSMMKNCTCWSS